MHTNIVYIQKHPIYTCVQVNVKKVNVTGERHLVPLTSMYFSIEESLGRSVIRNLMPLKVISAGWGRPPFTWAGWGALETGMAGLMMLRRGWTSSDRRGGRGGVRWSAM